LWRLLNPIPERYQTVTSYLIIKDVAGLIEFLKKAFKAEESALVEMPDGSIMHAEVIIGDSKVMMCGANDEYPPRSAPC